LTNSKNFLPVRFNFFSVFAATLPPTPQKTFVQRGRRGGGRWWESGSKAPPNPNSPTPNPSRKGEGSIYTQGQETIDEQKAIPQNNACQLEEPPQKNSNQQTEEVTTPLSPWREVGGEAGSSFLSRFREAVEARLDDSDLSVDDLAADMNISCVQLYRKVKAVTGSSPIELLRTARLNRAYQLLLTTDKSVSEVAYAVGFTAPSYFTKCFKEEYGMVPGDVRK
jgi:AraC-like DNA-binding protein